MSASTATAVARGSIYRTYHATDLAGNTLTLVLHFVGSGAITLHVVSLRYNDGPVLAPDARGIFSWAAARDGSLTSLVQDVHAEGAHEVATYIAAADQTTITHAGPNGVSTERGLVLERLVTSNGQFTLAH